MSAVRLFVYGSLRRDSEGKSHPLLASARYLGAATVDGALYRVYRSAESRWYLAGYYD